MALEQSILLKTTTLVYGILRQCNHFHPLKYLKLFKYHGIWVCVYVCVLVFQSCLTFCNPMDCSPPGSSVHCILQARILKWVAIPFSRGSSWMYPGLPHYRQILYCLSHQGSLSGYKTVNKCPFKIMFEKNSYCCFSDQFMISLYVQWNVPWLTCWVWLCV